MTEAQELLCFIKQQGGKDYEVAELTGVSRPTICKIRSGNYPDYTGESILSELRDIATKLGYRRNTPLPPSPRIQQAPVKRSPAIPPSRTLQTPVTLPQKKAHATRVQPAHMPAYKVGTAFNCRKCHFRNKARSVNSYCVNCEAPYTTY